MIQTWNDAAPPTTPAPGPFGWTLALARALVLGVLVFGGLAVMLALRLIERPIFGLRRPVTPFITQAVCRGAFLVMGIRRTTRGRPMRARGAVVANHASWLDIFALNAQKRIYFVSKAEVAGWPGIGWLARATGTVFINRDRREAQRQTALFEARLRAGHKLLFFPEGTSTDGRRVLPFKTTLFQAFLAEGLPADLAVQPVTLAYHAPAGADPRLYGWWGDMGFGAHLLQVLAQPRQGRVEVIYHPALPVASAGGRKALARAAEEAVRQGLQQAGITPEA